MNNTSKVELLRKWYDTGDRTLMDTECVWELAKGFPHGGTYTGSKAVFEDFFPRLLGDFENWQPQVDEIVDTGEMVLGLGHYHGRVRATGIEVKVPFAHLWKVRDGKIVWARQYTDTLLVAHALAAGA